MSKVGAIRSPSVDAVSSATATSAASSAATSFNWIHPKSVYPMLTELQLDDSEKTLVSASLLRQAQLLVALDMEVAQTDMPSCVSLLQVFPRARVLLYRTEANDNPTAEDATAMNMTTLVSPCGEATLRSWGCVVNTSASVSGGTRAQQLSDCLRALSPQRVDILDMTLVLHSKQSACIEALRQLRSDQRPKIVWCAYGGTLTLRSSGSITNADVHGDEKVPERGNINIQHEIQTGAECWLQSGYRLYRLYQQHAVWVHDSVTSFPCDVMRRFQFLSSVYPRPDKRQLIALRSWVQHNVPATSLNDAREHDSLLLQQAAGSHGSGSGSGSGSDRSDRALLQQIVSQMTRRNLGTIEPLNGKPYPLIEDLMREAISVVQTKCDAYTGMHSDTAIPVDDLDDDAKRANHAEPKAAASDCKEASQSKCQYQYHCQRNDATSSERRSNVSASEGECVKRANTTVVDTARTAVVDGAMNLHSPDQPSASDGDHGDSRCVVMLNSDLILYTGTGAKAAGVYEAFRQIDHQLSHGCDLVVGVRYDFADSMEEDAHTTSLLGYDMFATRSLDFLRSVPKTSFRLGVEWWDYLLPVHARRTHRRYALWDKKLLLHKHHECSRTPDMYEEFRDEFLRVFPEWQTVQLPLLYMAVPSLIEHCAWNPKRQFCTCEEAERRDKGVRLSIPHTHVMSVMVDVPLHTLRGEAVPVPVHGHALATPHAGRGAQVRKAVPVDYLTIPCTLQR